MNTRKKPTKTVYKDESDESAAGDFSASASEAEITEGSSSEEESDNSAEHFAESATKNKRAQPRPAAARPKQKFAKQFLSRLTQQTSRIEEENDAPTFSVKDLTEQDKLLPAVLNLSESDSSDNEEPSKKKVPVQHAASTSAAAVGSQPTSDSEVEAPTAYTDVWSKNVNGSSEEVALKSFQRLQQHTDMMQETRATIERYRCGEQAKGTDVDGLLALGEAEENAQKAERMETSGSEIEDWEEVKDSKPLPQSGLQLVVDFPGALAKKSKELDVEMMMRRKINRVKKEYQIYMHKVHVLSWLAHGNYVNGVLNDEDVMAAALSLLPSEKSYPSERVDINYLIQISEWYREKMKLKPDRHENKFKPNAPPLKQILLKQIKNQTVTSIKYLCYIFVSMLRALGLQCRIVLNFVTVPIRPPTSELCSLATKHKAQPEKKSKSMSSKSETSVKREPQKARKTSKTIDKKPKIPQLDGNDDSLTSWPDMEYSGDEQDNSMIMQLDGNDDSSEVRITKRSTRSNKLSLEVQNEKSGIDEDNDINKDVSPPKRRKPMSSNYEGKNESKLDSKSTSETSKLNKNAKKNPKFSKQKNATETTTTKTEIETENSDKSVSIDKILVVSNIVKKIQNKKTEVTERSSNKAERKTVSSNKLQNDHSTHCNARKGVIKEKKIINTEPPTSPKPSPSKQISKETLQPKPSRVSRNRNSKSKECQTINKSKNISSEFFADTAKSKNNITVPQISVTSTDDAQNPATEGKLLSLKRSHSTSASNSKTGTSNLKSDSNASLKKLDKTRTRSAPGKPVETSKYFDESLEKKSVKSRSANTSRNKNQKDSKRVSHRDLIMKSPEKTGQLDIKKDLMSLIKGRVREAKSETQRKTVKGKIKVESDDSDYLPEETLRRASSEDFKSTKVRPKSAVSARKLDRRVLSTDDDSGKKLGIDVWCEVFVEEVEQWVSVDVVKPQVHCAEMIYSRASHPVSYAVGWDNSNRLKDLTRRYVPHWNTTTRRLRAEPGWWEGAVGPWRGRATPRDREEDRQLDRLMFDAPLPKSIAEYKNHPLYALKRHLLKFEALYPAEEAPVGFVRGEAVYPRACVHTCRSRDTWLKEAKTVRRGERPYKVVKARPKWDKLSNKAITDMPLEVFGPWQVEDYEPPTAEGGVVPRNAYGNVELFKQCMLPKGTVHIQLAGLNKTAKKLNIDCAPAMTGFDFHGGWTHPVFDGFVVCSEFEELLTDAWVKDQEEAERRERDKVETRVYGNWKRLIKGLLIRERLQRKYAFEREGEDAAGSGGGAGAGGAKRKRGPRLLVKK